MKAAEVEKQTSILCRYFLLVNIRDHSFFIKRFVLCHMLNNDSRVHFHIAHVVSYPLGRYPEILTPAVFEE